MKKFYTPVDLRSRAAMTAYLEGHFRYPTANAWNQATSYACNLKVDRLGLHPELVDTLLGMLDTDEFQAEMQELRRRFGEKHNYYWQVGMNGRSGGYLVLYQGYSKPSGYRSYCRLCGQQNFKSIAESGNICGRCGQPSRVDYAHPPREIGVYPGRGTDDCADFEDWSMTELRNRVSLVQELDRLADEMVALGLDYARHYSVEDEEFYLPRTRKILVPRAQGGRHALSV